MPAQHATTDQLGAERDDDERMEAKQPPPQVDVPGVRGPIRASGEPEDATDPEAGTWGSEGGAGSYQGAPTISNAPPTPKQSSKRTWARETR